MRESGRPKFFQDVDVVRVWYVSDGGDDKVIAIRKVETSSKEGGGHGELRLWPRREYIARDIMASNNFKRPRSLNDQRLFAYT